MSRRTQAPTRTVLPDPKFGSPMLAKFMNMVMLDGKKSAAERILYGAIDRIAEKTGREGDAALELVTQALDNVKPAVEVKSRRVGGATYQVPVEVKPGRAHTLALRWLVGYSRARRETTMTDRLMNEILDASNGLGASVKKREDTHKMAEANKAFAHYRW
jgi:small subunit ribosomal protein S7